ncbi:MAG TPA: SRPBCC family protein [Fibrobacteria bacterium]|nr:SRPBCC family protein [Fibrobacteria bacterium]
MDGSRISMDAAGPEGAADDNYGYGIRTETKINVAMPERWISAAIGGGLVLYGIRKRSRLGILLALAGGNLLLRGILGRSLLYQSLGINTAGKAKAVKRAIGSGSFRVEKSISVDRSPEDVYRFWRNFENLPRVMKHLKSVRTIDDRRSHWVAKAPAGLGIEWDAEITEDRENRKTSWRSLDSSGIRNNGAVVFEPVSDGRGTDLRIYLEYELPAGKAGKALAKLFGKDPDRMVDEDLRRFKTLMEAGEPAYGRTQPA